MATNYSTAQTTLSSTLSGSGGGPTSLNALILTLPALALRLQQRGTATFNAAEAAFVAQMRALFGDLQ